MRQAVSERRHIAGDGYFTKKSQQMLEELLGVPRVLLTSSCTHALEMMPILLDIQPGDEVIIPSFTFVSTVNAFILRGAVPVFVDIRPDTQNLDERLLESRITPRTKAVIVVHYAGVACEMDQIQAICDKYRIALLEDNAHGLFGRYRNQNLGTFGVMATQSFHETKNIISGEGGALVIKDAAYIERAEIIREKGTNRSQFFRGQVDKYTWVDIGSSYLMSDISAAYLTAQLEQQATIQQRRHEIWASYAENLHDWAGANGVTLPYVPPHCEHPAHIFYMLLPTLSDRQKLIARLKQHGIMAVFHYQPLHLSPMGLQYGYKQGDCPVTEDIADRLVRLPLFYDLTPDQQGRVIDLIVQTELMPN